MGTFGNLNTINSAGFASDNAQIAEFQDDSFLIQPDGRFTTPEKQESTNKINQIERIPIVSLKSGT